MPTNDPNSPDEARRSDNQDPAQYWIDRWQEGRTGFHRDAPHPWLREFGAEVGVQPGARVLVPLSGKSLDLLWIEQQGGQVAAIELAEQAVESFHRENSRTFERSAIQGRPRYLSGSILTLVDDIFDVSPESLSPEGSAQNSSGPFDLIYDRAALIALDPPTRQRYAAHIARFLAPQGKILLVTADYEQSEMAGPPFSVPDSEVQALFPDFHHEPKAEQNLLVQEERWRERGLSRMAERCAVLSRR